MNRNLLSNKKGLALPIIFLIAAVLIPMGIGLVYLLKQDTRMTVKSKASLQVDQLAEGAGNRGFMEVRKRLSNDFNINVSSFSYTAAQIQTYVANPMDFIYDCLWDPSSATDLKFSTAPAVNAAVLVTTGILSTGNYSYTVTISTTNTPIWDNVNLRAQFFLKYKVIGRAESNSKMEKSSVVLDSSSISAPRAGGEFEVVVQLANFARYNLFCNSLQSSNWFTDTYSFSGPVHFNDELNFYGHATTGMSAIFNDELSTTSNTVNFFHGGSLPQDFFDEGDGVAGAGDDRPVFNGGFIRGADAINMPTFVQMQDQVAAASFGLGVATTTLAAGVYVPNDGANVTGGIYIEGDVTSLTMSTPNANKALYTIVHSNGTTYTVEVNMASGKTKIDGVNYDGIMNGVIFTNNGSINALSGTVQKDSQVTIAATDDVTITNHIQYADDPIVNPSAANVLGLMSWDEDIWVGTTAPNDLTVQASIMTPDGFFEIKNYDICGVRGDLNLLGGVIGDEMGYHGMFDSTSGNLLSGYNDRYIYDVRFRAGLAPPMFPSTGRYVGSVIDFNAAPSWKYQVN